MSQAESKIEMFTIGKSLGGEDIEAGNRSGHILDIESNIPPSESLSEKMEYGESSNGHTDDIDKWAGSLARMLEDVPHYMCSPGHPGRISRIPGNLREVNPKAYEPHFLSIGPYHYGKPSVQSMEKRKWLLLKCVLEYRPELTLKDYLQEIKSIELAAKSFYSDVNMDSDKFVQMLLLDRLYIVTTFCGMSMYQETMSLTITTGSEVDNEDTNDRVNNINESILSGDNNVDIQMMARADESNSEMGTGESNATRLFSSLFEHDLLLLENQIPFFVLQKMYAFVCGGSDVLLLDIMKEKVRDLLAPYSNLNSEFVISPIEKVHHLLHLCHLFFRPSHQQESTSCQLPESSEMFRLGSAMQLYEAGVTFEARSGSAEQYCLLDITLAEESWPCHVCMLTITLIRS